jgi:hypothetical protein
MSDPANKPRCEREGLTPIPDHGVLLIDCTVHGPVGVVTAGADEYGRADAEFAKHSSEASLLVRQWQDTAQGLIHRVAELEARRDAALELTEQHPLRHWDTQWPIRAALEGMTPAEYAGDEPPLEQAPDFRRTWAPGMDPFTVHVERVPPADPKRCCIGPFADGTHAPGCLDACQDCGGSEITCRCRG